MGFDDLVNKAKDALKSDKAEEISDSALDRAEDLAGKVGDGKYADKASDIRNTIDGKIGNE